MRAHAHTVPRRFDHRRSRPGDEVELLSEIHARVPPIQAIGLAKELEQFHLFFLEGPVAPEDAGYFPMLRA